MLSVSCNPNYVVFCIYSMYVVKVKSEKKKALIRKRKEEEEKKIPNLNQAPMSLNSSHSNSTLPFQTFPCLSIPFYHISSYVVKERALTYPWFPQGQFWQFLLSLPLSLSSLLLLFLLLLLLLLPQLLLLLPLKKFFQAGC